MKRCTGDEESVDGREREGGHSGNNTIMAKAMWKAPNPSETAKYNGKIRQLLRQQQKHQQNRTNETSYG